MCVSKLMRTHKFVIVSTTHYKVFMTHQELFSTCHTYLSPFDSTTIHCIVIFRFFGFLLLIVLLNTEITYGIVVTSFINISTSSFTFPPNVPCLQISHHSRKFQITHLLKISSSIKT